MGLLDDATDAANWSEHPARTAGQAALCLLGAPFCLAQNLGEEAGVQAERLRRDTIAQIDATRDAVEREVDETRRAVTEPSFVERIRDSIDSVEGIMMWIAIGIAIVAGLIVLGVGLYFLWPVLAGLRAGAR